MLRRFFSQSPELKSPREIGLMRESGKLVARALQICRDMAKPGARTGDIDRAVDEFYARHGAIPLFKGYPGQKVPFPASTCISLNAEVVHGIPGSRTVREDNFRSEEGLGLAVEPMVNMGRADTDTLRDHWTVVTRDGLPSAHVEHTFAITNGGVLVVTADENAERGTRNAEPPMPPVEP